MCVGILRRSSILKLVSDSSFTRFSRAKHKDPAACKTVVTPEQPVEFPKCYQKRAALYVHWPYCQRRCTYCNFNKYVKRNVDQSRMQNCLVQEAETIIEMLGIKHITSIFIGGGTPSLAHPDVVASIVSAVQGILEDGAEVTIECNPTSVQSEKLEEFKKAGVNRVSLGVQTLLDEDLKVLGRDHTVDQSLQCLETAKQLFKGHTSVDIMFGRPRQTLESWKNELSALLNICDDHVSLYELTLERGTSLFKSVSNNQLSVPKDHVKADMYRYAVDRFDADGWCQYEVSNFARNGAVSKHNTSYWNGSLYIGLGPGAHSRVICDGRREARIQTLEPDPWMREVEMYGHGTRRRVQQSLLDCLFEVLMLGLRTNVGVRNSVWSTFCDTSLITIFESVDVVKQLCSNGLLLLDGNGMRTTPRGLAIIDNILPHLYVALTDFFNKN